MLEAGVAFLLWKAAALADGREGPDAIPQRLSARPACWPGGVSLAAGLDLRSVRRPDAVARPMGAASRVGERMSGKGATDSLPNDGPRQAVWIVVPAYNEQTRLATTLAALRARRDPVVVVDDGSTDRTGQIADQEGVWYLRHLFNCGQGAALQTGIDFAVRRGARIIVTFDADGQHMVEDIERVVQPIREGRADVVLGSRFLGSTVGLPRTRWLILKLGVLFTRLFSRVRVTDTHNGLRAFSREAAQRIHITMGGMAHASEILEQIREHDLRYCEVPVTIKYFDETLEKGQSNWNGLRIVARLFVGRIVR